MILEYLQPDPNIWDGITVVVRAAYYAATLGAAGLAMFQLGFGDRLPAREQEGLCRWLIWAALGGIALSLLAALVRVQILSAGEITNPDVWLAMFRSRIGDAFYIRVAGLALILTLATRWRLAPALAGAGVLMVVASYAAMGHSMLYQPRQELAALVAIHLAAVAFWFGSLPPLATLAARGDAAAASLMREWSRLAIAVVIALAAAGAALGVLLVQRADMMAGSWYGNGFIVKLGLVVAVLALAAWHRAVMTGRMERQEPGAAPALARSIRIEFVLMLAVFYAAAEMVSVHPVDLGHRIAP